MSDLIDSLEERLRSATDQREKIDAMNALAWAIRRQEPERAFALSDEAQALCQDVQFTEWWYVQGIAESLCVQSSLNSYRGNAEDALQQALEAVSLFENADLEKLLPKALYLAAISYQDLGQMHESLEYSSQQIEVSERVGDKEWYARGLSVLSTTYEASGNYKRATFYSEQALPIFRELGNSYWITLVLTNLSELYVFSGKYDQALKVGREALKIASQEGHQRTEVIATMRVGEAYMAAGDLDNAIEYLQIAADLSKESDYPDNEIDILIALGRLYHRRGQPEESIPRLQAALAIAERTHHKRVLYKVHHRLSEVYKSTAEFEKALQHYEQFHIIRRSVLDEESEKRLKNLEATYRTETAQKEADYYASLYKAEQSQRRLAEVLNQVGRALSGTLNLNEVLDQILAQLEKLVNYDRGALLMLSGTTLEFVAALGFAEGRDPLQYKVPIDTENRQDVFVRIYESQQPLALANVSEYEGWARVGDEPLPGSWLGVPLIHNNQVTGMLSLARLEVSPYSEEEITLATTFAAQSAIALQNAQLYGRVQRFNEQMNYEVKHRTAALQEAYEQVERLDRTKSSFIAVTAHELRTPITVLKGYSQLLEKDSTIASNAYYSNLVEGIVSGANRMHEIVNTMLMMVKIDSQELEVFPEPLDMHHVIERVVAELDVDLDDRQQMVVIDPSMKGLPPIEGDREALLTVFTNLMINAIKYTPDGGQIEIYGRSWTESPDDVLPPNSIEVIVKDNGIGIVPSALELIFTKFYQTGEVAYHSSGRTKFKGGGPGLGLAIARGVVEAHRGRLWAESDGYDEENCPGSAFYVVLPLKQRRR